MKFKILESKRTAKEIIQAIKDLEGYKKENGAVYQPIINLKKENIFDAANSDHLQQLEAITNKETIDVIKSTISHGAGDWGTLSQFIEEIESLGFTGMKSLERPGENISINADESFDISGKPVYSLGFFHEVPVVKIAT